MKGYFISEQCIECGLCVKNCPQKVIIEGTPFKISQEHCLHCGICYEIVGNNGVIRGRVEDLYDDNSYNVNNIKVSSDALNYIITNEK